MTRDEIVAKMDAIVNLAEVEKRSMTLDEIKSYEGAETELQTFNKSEEVQKRNASLHAVKNVGLIAKTGPEPKGDAVLDAAFFSYLRTGIANADIKGLYQAYTSDQNVGTASAGGYLVPPGYLVRIVERLKAFGGVATKAEEIVTATGNPIQFPTNDDTANSGEVAAEGADTASGADLIFGTVTLGAFTYRAGGADNKGIKASLQLVQDSAFDVASFVARKIGTRIGRKQAADLVNGTGSAQPRGLLYNSPDYNMADGNALTYANLLDLFHLVDPAYRQLDCAWVMADSAVRQLEGLVDGNGRPLLQPALTMSLQSGVAVPGQTTVLGHPVIIDQAVRAWSATEGSNDATDSTVDAADGRPGGTTGYGTEADGLIAFGAINEAMIIRRVQDVTILADPYSGMSVGEMRWHAFARMDSAIKDRAAFAILAGFHA
jgi:HK97 family phage major capsid protein